uniref:Uncharacterized protein n=1 Tax=Arundo donax TaxID=35708 RepID=A0A0A9C549_ARUDO
MVEMCENIFFYYFFFLEWFLLNIYPVCTIVTLTYPIIAINAQIHREALCLQVWIWITCISYGLQFSLCLNLHKILKACC